MACTEEYREHIEYTFHAFCKVVIRNASYTALRTRSRKNKREISLDSCCYYALLGDGVDYFSATKALEGQDVLFKKELLTSYGIDYNALPHWQRYGAVLHYEQTEKQGSL